MSDFTFATFRPANGSLLRRAVADSVSLLQDMLRARSTRRMLADMDDRLLADIGVGRGDAIDEARRPMWDLTQRRR